MVGGEGRVASSPPLGGCDKNVGSLSPPDLELQEHMNGQIINNLHKYWSHLFALDSCRPLAVELSGNQSCGSQWDTIMTPLVLREWKR